MRAGDSQEGRLAAQQAAAAHDTAQLQRGTCVYIAAHGLAATWSRSFDTHPTCDLCERLRVSRGSTALAVLILRPG